VSASCPKCRRNTWSAKWAHCSACGYPKGDPVTKSVIQRKKRDGKRNGVTQTVTTSTSDGDEAQYVSVGPVPGQPCPTCGRKVPIPQAQRQKAYRERKRG